MADVFAPTSNAFKVGQKRLHQQEIAGDLLHSTVVKITQGLVPRSPGLSQRITSLANPSENKPHSFSQPHSINIQLVVRRRRLLFMNPFRNYVFWFIRNEVMQTSEHVEKNTQLPWAESGVYYGAYITECT